MGIKKFPSEGGVHVPPSRLVFTRDGVGVEVIIRSVELMI